MIKTKLNNGLRIIYESSKNNIFTINVAVLTSPIYESKKNNGISHYLEHMVFEGTINRTCQQISFEIEQYGGEINAYTSNEKTNFYIKIHKKYAEKAIKILADILINPSFDKKAIEKEKKVIIGEIKMINDEPRHYQWSLFQQKLFKKPFSNTILGSKSCILNLKKQDLIKYHKKYYTANNTIITIIGKCNPYLKLIKKYFKYKNKTEIIKKPEYNIKNSKKEYKIKKKNLKLQYLIIGYQTPLRKEKDSFILDVITAILAKGQSGKLFSEIRTKRGLTYNLGIYNNSGFSHSYFAFYSNAEKNKIPLIENIFFTELNKLKNISSKDLKDAKTYLEGQIALKIEDSQEYADSISLFEECGNYKQFETYIKNIKSVNKNDIKNVINKYLNEKYTKILIV
jgi:predicted Zn-dependent peptidase